MFEHRREQSNSPNTALAGRVPSGHAEIHRNGLFRSLSPQTNRLTGTGEDEQIGDGADVMLSVAAGNQLLRIGMAATAAPDWQSALNAITRASLGYAGADRSTLLLWDQVNDELEVAADSSVAGMVPITVGVRVPIERWPALRATLLSRTPKVLVRHDPHLAGERKLLAGIGAAGMLALPLWSDHDALGLLLLFSRRSDAFAGGAMGRDIAAVAGQALATARLLDRSRRVESAQAALFRVSQAAISAPDRDSLLREITMAATDVVRCDVCVVECWHQETEEIETIALHSAGDWVGERARLSRGRLDGLRSVRLALETRAPVLVHPSQPGLTDAELARLRALSAECLLIVPMTIGGETLGIFSFASKRARAFDRESIDFAMEIAAQTALALQHAQNVERSRRQAQEQAALLQVSRAVISGRSLRDVLDEITQTALTLEFVDVSRIWLWHWSSQELELVAEGRASKTEGFFRPGNRYPIDDWPTIAAALGAGEARCCLDTDPMMPERERANHIADGLRSSVMLPILVGDEALGCLALHSSQPRRFSDDVSRFGQELAEQAAHAIDRARLYRRLRARAETDGLTGLLNHRAAFEALDAELNRARESGGSVGVIVVDLDDFKLFNDTHGHLVGDRVLVEVANVLKRCVGDGDRVARYGGDEFLLILPGANSLASQEVAQRIVQEMDRATVQIDAMELPVRCSVGVATFPQDARNRPALIAYADSSMYAAKELGGGQVGSIHRGTRSLEVSTLGALSGLVRAVDRKDRYTKDHSDLVAEYAVRFARALNLPAEKIEALELAGQLHDVGKIAVPDSILRKPGHLTPEEEAMIRQHVVFSELMIKGVPHLDDVLAAVAHHHERWDGSGYPRGKRGQEIPLLGRILALCDALAAMTYDRPYRKGRSLQQAVEEIRAGAGTQFDPDLVEPFIRAVSSRAGLLNDAERRAMPTTYARPAATPVPAPLPVSQTLKREVFAAAGGE